MEMSDTKGETNEAGTPAASGGPPLEAPGALQGPRPFMLVHSGALATGSPPVLLLSPAAAASAPDGSIERLTMRQEQ